MEKLSEYLKKKEQWTKGTFGRNKLGIPMSEYSHYCMSRCLVGWCHYLYRDVKERRLMLEALRKEIQPFNDDMSITGFNDDPNTTFTKIKQLVKRAEKRLLL